MPNAQFIRFVGGGGSGSNNVFSPEILIRDSVQPRMVFQDGGGGGLSRLQDAVGGVGIVYRDDVGGGIARWQIDRTTGKLVIGTVPLDQIGTVQVDASTAVAANTVSDVTLAAASATPRFYVPSVRGSATVQTVMGSEVNAAEAVVAAPHAFIMMATSVTADLLRLVNGTAASVTYIYKIYLLTES